MPKSIQASYYRGGTSRALVIHRKGLPADESEWPGMFLSILGSPDPYGRQLDGMGCGISSLSKVCVVDTSSRSDADVDYTFFAVGIQEDEVDTSANCGNMSAAIGPYAVEHGMLNHNSEVASGKQNVTVRIWNTNTQKVIRSTFAVTDGELDMTEQISIDGVNGTAPPIGLEFMHPAGAKTGLLLPSGQVYETIDDVEMSCIDAANPCIFLQASDLNLDPTISPETMLSDPYLMDRIERFRHAAAVRMKLIKAHEPTPRSIPKVGLVSPATDYRLRSGKMQSADEVNVIIQFVSDRQFHKAIPGTASICSGVAAMLEGSVVAKNLSQKRMGDGDTVVIGHSSGKISCRVSREESGEIRSATVWRTARRIMEGTFFFE